MILILVTLFCTICISCHNIAGILHSATTNSNDNNNNYHLLLKKIKTTCKKIDFFDRSVVIPKFSSIPPPYPPQSIGSYVGQDGHYH